MTNVSSEIEQIVETADLPRRLKDRVYHAIDARDGDVTTEQAGEITQAVEARYRETRVDPLDPVGTISAQSIGEPGTQMSVPYDEEILIREEGIVRAVEIGPFADEHLADADVDVREFDGHEVALAPAGVEVLSLRADERVEWKPVEEVSRHAAPAELLELQLESGRSIRATHGHSFVARTDHGLAPVAASTLTTGDQLPVVGRFEAGADLIAVDSIPGEHGHADAGGSVIEVQRGVSMAAWEEITSIHAVPTTHEFVYDVSVAGLETFTTAAGVVTHNTMNTFHYAGVAEIDVTQGLPRLIELVDARKEPDTPMMTVYLDEVHAVDRAKAHEVVWKIEATRILALGDVSTNVADMVVRIDLNEATLRERWPRAGSTDEVAAVIADTIEAKLGVSTAQSGTVIEFGPAEPSYRELLQLVEQLREIVFKGIDAVGRVVIRKEQHNDRDEFVLYTEGSAFGKVLDIEGVDPTRTTTNNIHEIYRTLGVEAAREAIIEETMSTLEEQGLDDVNIRHLMLVSDIMTHRGVIESIGRHGISGSKESVLARAAFEVTVNHLLDAAVHGEIDDLNGVTENVIVGKPIKLGTGDVNLRMRAAERADGGSSVE